MFLNTIIVIFVIAVTSVASLRPEIPGVPLVLSRPNSSRAVAKSCLEPRVSTCLDCNQIAACVDGKEDVAISCKSIKNERPFCVTNNGVSTCQATPDIISGCSVPVESFKCTGAGYFPSSTDCTKYYICNSDGVSHPYVCPDPGFMYNPATTMCTYWGTKLAEKCNAQVVKCNGASSLFLPFVVPNNNFYVYCKPDANFSFENPTQIVLQCPVPFKFVDNTCQFVCENEGVFAYPGSNTSFVNCLYAGPDSSLITEVITCPTDMEFNGQNCS